MALAQSKMRRDIEFNSLIDSYGNEHDSCYKPNAALTSSILSSFSHVNNSTSRV